MNAFNKKFKRRTDRILKERTQWPIYLIKIQKEKDRKIFTYFVVQRSLLSLSCISSHLIPKATIPLLVHEERDANRDKEEGPYFSEKKIENMTMLTQAT